jgi:hypothetical protein
VVRRFSSNGTTQATTPKDLLSQSFQSIEVSAEQSRFAYLAPDLIGQGKGIEYCKACNSYYEAKELKRVVVGHGESPLSVNVKGKGWLRRVFGKKQRLLLFGGKGLKRPYGHEVIAVVTWRT